MTLTLDQKIEMVKRELFKYFPACPHTVKILLWDDGTDLVECRYGDGEQIHAAVYYNGMLSFTSEKMLSNMMRAADGSGREIFVMTAEEYALQLRS